MYIYVLQISKVSQTEKEKLNLRGVSIFLQNRNTSFLLGVGLTVLKKIQVPDFVNGFISLNANAVQSCKELQSLSHTLKEVP